ncbi:unnamed protein product [Symbiodinium natans]|uniref:Uncharacterized protein n=1 Tax=Symbiodinium natans TaxID=878477 RepID=A0A812T1Q4_9DINO|nr:unnamed protein product [Symbiodinium natans]
MRGAEDLSRIPRREHRVSGAIRQMGAGSHTELCTTSRGGDRAEVCIAASGVGTLAHEKRLQISFLPIFSNQALDRGRRRFRAAGTTGGTEFVECVLKRPRVVTHQLMDRDSFDRAVHVNGSHRARQIIFSREECAEEAGKRRIAAHDGVLSSSAGESESTERSKVSRASRSAGSSRRGEDSANPSQRGGSGDGSARSAGRPNMGRPQGCPQRFGHGTVQKPRMTSRDRGCRWRRAEHKRARISGDRDRSQAWMTEGSLSQGAALAEAAEAAHDADAVLGVCWSGSCAWLRRAGVAGAAMGSSAEAEAAGCTR